MHRAIISAAVVVLSYAAQAQAQAQAQATAQSAPLDCGSGPVSRTFGEVPWLVYGCSDNKTVVVMSAPGSPAMPFYFTLFEKEGRYVVYGEGTGAREFTGKAHAELVKLSSGEIARLLAAVGRVQGGAK